MANRPLQTFAGVLVLVTLAMIGLTVNPRPAFGKKALTPIRFRFTIDPKTPIKDLLPPAPLSEGKTAFLPADLAQVAEVHFQKPVLVKVGIGKLTSEEEAAWAKASEKGVSDIAHQMAKINFLNEKKADGFMEALLENRPDLAGLPFTLGGACRLKTNEHAQFREAVSLVHGSLAEKFGSGSTVC